ncbi:MAG: hypothetical protein M1830_009210 [Pleopsidium flavum]|nr:MAG: hypothetical protein M1830_009210 [Pleopsidium flavum]
MSHPSASLIPDSQPPTDELDTEIATIRAEITSLTRRRSILRSSLLASKSTPSLLERVRPALNGASNSTNDSHGTSTLTATAQNRAQKQAKHNQTNLYRICAGATMFEVHDPDPHAVDNGRVHGIRIEAFINGKFIPPYYILLNRPYPPSPALRIHRHTIPPCIPLPALAAKYLPLPPPPPPPPSANAVAPVKTRPQNLPRLVRELRREIVGFHMRQGSLQRLRTGLGLGLGVGEKGKPTDITKARNEVKDISAMDAEGTDIRIKWGDGRIGRVKVTKDGSVEKAVVFGDKGRERRVERVLVGGEGRIEGLAERLGEV